MFAFFRQATRNGGLMAASVHSCWEQRQNSGEGREVCWKWRRRILVTNHWKNYEMQMRMRNNDVVDMQWRVLEERRRWISGQRRMRKTSKATVINNWGRSENKRLLWHNEGTNVLLMSTPNETRQSLNTWGSLLCKGKETTRVRPPNYIRWAELQHIPVSMQVECVNVEKDFLTPPVLTFMQIAICAADWLRKLIINIPWWVQLMSDSGYSAQDVNEQLIPFWLTGSLWCHLVGQDGFF